MLFLKLKLRLLLKKEKTFKRPILGKCPFLYKSCYDKKSLILDININADTLCT